MSAALQAMPKDFSEMMNISKTMFESGMFSDIKSMAMALVKVQAGMEIGIPPFQAMNGIHIIQGKAVVGATLIASKVAGSGKYHYRTRVLDETKCVIDFYEGSTIIGTSTFTVEDARKASTKNMDKFPRNMLFARAISNGVKWYTPDVFSTPVYVEGEITETDVIEDIPHEVIHDAEMQSAIEGIKIPQTVKDLLAYRDSVPDEIKEKGVFLEPFVARHKELKEQ